MTANRTTLAHVIKALTIAVRDCLGVEENDRDIEEGYKRPSFFIDVSDITDNVFTDEFTVDEYALDVFYFAPERETGFLDLINAREKLSELLRGYLVTDTGTGITFDNVKHRVEKRDKTLVTTFDITIVQRIEDTGMEPLITDLSLGLERTPATVKEKTTDDSNIFVDDEDRADDE